VGLGLPTLAPPLTGECFAISAIDKPFHPSVRKHLVDFFGEPTADDGVTFLYNGGFNRRHIPFLSHAARSVAGHHLHCRAGGPVGSFLPLRDGRTFEVTTVGWVQL
jgi:hypothetical protein